MGRTNNITKNCHYISRFLTRPWEAGQRHLHYYDFVADEFRRSSSEKLFADSDLNSPAVEQWLNKVIETPLGAARPKLTAADPSALNNWDFFKAAVLMLWLQGVRVSSLAEDDSKRHLDSMAAAPPEHIDALVNAIRAEFELRLVFTVTVGEAYAPLCFPSTGVFSFAYPDPGCLSGFAVGLGLPLDPTCALINTPAQKKSAADLSQLPASLSNYSVGGSTATRVVVPEAALKRFPEAELASILKEQRAANDEQRQLMGKLHGLIADAHDIVGVPVMRDMAGRLLTGTDEKAP